MEFRGSAGKAPGWSGGKEREITGRSLCCGFWGKERARQGQQGRTGWFGSPLGSGAQELPLVVWYLAGLGRGSVAPSASCTGGGGQG